MEEKVDETFESQVEVLKPYKEKQYFNSNKEPFGITLNGKSRGYIAAHDKVKALMIKKKNIVSDVGRFKVLDTSRPPGFINATVEVENGDDKGNVDIKVYNPSLNKKKGATIEIRKLSDFDFKHVEILRDIITSLLDKYLTQEESTNETKYYTCDICKLQKRFEAALKGHKKKYIVS